MHNYLNLDHAGYMSTFTSEMRRSYATNIAAETLISGAVVLFWKHNCNVAYLNHALQFARSRKGMRVNAVRAFLVHFTGAVFDKKTNSFKKAGRKVKWLTAEFDQIESWADWANEKAPEPVYNLEKVQLKLVNLMRKEAEKAREHGKVEFADLLEKEVIELSQVKAA